MRLFSLRSLARAVVHAANIGAQVINISEAACYKVTRPINETGLGAAINYAVNVKGAARAPSADQKRIIAPAYRPCSAP